MMGPKHDPGVNVRCVLNNIIIFSILFGGLNIPSERKHPILNNYSYSMSINVSGMDSFRAVMELLKICQERDNVDYTLKVRQLNL